MTFEFPSAVPEIPVREMAAAIAYYRDNLGFSLDWGGQEIGLAGISKGRCRMFLADEECRQQYGNVGPTLTWLNLESTEEVDELYREWMASNARLTSAPESKPWGLHEFVAADLDGNLFRVFFDFGTHMRTAALAFTKRLREEIRRGTITRSVRVWRQPHLKVGDEHIVDDGRVVVDSVEEISLEHVTDDILSGSSFHSVADLRRMAAPGEDEHIYLIRFHYVPSH
jgi:uncharacterized glyoxalase superfamily protein PhnB